MKRHLWAWVAVPTLIGSASYFLGLEWGWPPWDRSLPMPTSARIEFPTTIDLGAHEIGEVVVGRFTMVNRGDRALVIDGVESNCSCTGLEREDGDGFARVDSLRLSPNESAALALRVSVRGIPVGAEMLNYITFRTNDPSQPTGRIRAIVRCTRGGVTTVPPRVVFGSVPVGASVKQVVRIYDDSLSAREIRSISSSRPDCVVARLLPADATAVDAARGVPGKAVANVEVTVRTTVPGEVDDSISIEMSDDGRAPSAIQVIGRVLAPVEISPSSLVLPRSSIDGSVFHATCICRSTVGGVLHLTVEACPPGVTVDVLDGQGAMRCVRVACARAEISRLQVPRRETVRFRAVAGTYKATLDLNVLLRPGK